jgi:drug/metabolite transporter (DMT)-like permease
MDRATLLRTPQNSLRPKAGGLIKRLMTGKIIVLIAILAVAAVLCMGLYTLWVGGETARTWSNKLMRIRILAQAIAVVIIMAVLYFSQHS